MYFKPLLFQIIKSFSLFLYTFGQIYEIPEALAAVEGSKLIRPNHKLSITERIKCWKDEVTKNGFAKCPNQNCQLCFLSYKGMMQSFVIVLSKYKFQYITCGKKQSYD